MNTLTQEAAGVKCAATPSTFDLWAEVYDAQVNPFLSLEERIAFALLPDLKGLDLLDAGCGTGRMLQAFRDREARSVIGVDSSPAMLDKARLVEDVDVRYGSCNALPVEDSSVDYIVSSFVLSYISELDGFVDELRRVSRPGARVVVSDMHPETSRRLGWKRSFRVKAREIEVAAHRRSISEVREAFAARGFHVRTCLEPGFGKPEERMFADAGRSGSFAEMRDVAAIYVLECVRETGSELTPRVCFTAARCALTPIDAAFATLAVSKGTMDSLDTQANNRHDLAINLSGYLVLPGLVNAHDHLEFGLFPRLGHGPYGNAAVWAEDIHREDAAVIALHRSVPREVRVWWGAIRNLLAGVTTVCHHNPVTREMFDAEFPVRVLRDFQWAHSLAMDAQLGLEFERSSPDEPFIVHAAEGVDPQSAMELKRLAERGVLAERTVLVHGLAISKDSVVELNKRGVALVVCPSSNAFLFGQVPATEVLTGVQKIALGSDSPLTAIGDLLDELRFAREHTELTDEELYRMATTAPAEILRLKQVEGRLAAGGFADFIATRDRGSNPAETLAQMSAADVELVVRAGRVFLSSDAIFERLSEAMRVGLELLIVDGERRWIRAPLEELFRGAAAVMDGDYLLLAGKKVSLGYAA